MSNPTDRVEIITSVQRRRAGGGLSLAKALPSRGTTATAMARSRFLRAGRLRRSCRVRRPCLGQSPDSRNAGAAVVHNFVEGRYRRIRLKSLKSIVTEGAGELRWDHPDDRRSLRPGRQRTEHRCCRRSAAEQCDERAPSHGLPSVRGITPYHISLALRGCPHGCAERPELAPREHGEMP